MTAADKVQDAVARLERISPDRCKRQTVKDQGPRRGARKRL